MQAATSASEYELFHARSASLRQAGFIFRLL